MTCGSHAGSPRGGLAAGSLVESTCWRRCADRCCRWHTTLCWLRRWPWCCPELLLGWSCAAEAAMASSALWGAIFAETDASSRGRETRESRQRFAWPGRGPPPHTSFLVHSGHLPPVLIFVHITSDSYEPLRTPVLCGCDGRTAPDFSHALGRDRPTCVSCRRLARRVSP